MLKRSFVVAIASLAIATVANATVVDVHWVSTDGDPGVQGSVRNDLLTTTTADWTNSAVFVNLSQGSLLDPMSTTPNRKFRGATNVNDTWTEVPNGPEPAMQSQTILLWDFDGDPGTYGAGYRIDWGDVDNYGVGADAGLSARVYASDNAMGTWWVDTWDQQSAGVVYRVTGNVVNGAFGTVPEPAGIVMLLAIAAAMTARMMVRRQKCR